MLTYCSFIKLLSCWIILMLIVPHTTSMWSFTEYLCGCGDIFHILCGGSQYDCFKCFTFRGKSYDCHLKRRSGLCIFSGSLLFLLQLQIRCTLLVPVVFLAVLFLVSLCHSRVCVCIIISFVCVWSAYVKCVFSHLVIPCFPSWYWIVYEYYLSLFSFLFHF